MSAQYRRHRARPGRTDRKHADTSRADWHRRREERSTERERARAADEARRCIRCRSADAPFRLGPNESIPSCSRHFDAILVRVTAILDGDCSPCRARDCAGTAFCSRCLETARIRAALGIPADGGASVLTGARP